MPWKLDSDKYCSKDTYNGMIDTVTDIGIIEYEGCGAHQISIPDPKHARMIERAKEMYELLHSVSGEGLSDSCPAIDMILELIDKE